MAGFFKEDDYGGRALDIPGMPSEKKEKKSRAPRIGKAINKLDEMTQDQLCGLCGLERQRGLHHPKLEPYGKGRKKVMVWGEAPGENEDYEGIPFCGKAGKFLRKRFAKHGLDLERDCIVINSCDCRPMEGDANRKPTAQEVNCCHRRKEELLKKYKPKVIFLLGDTAVKSFYSDPDRKFMLDLPLASFRGKVIPDLKAKAWVCHSYHPSYITRGNEDQTEIFDLDFKTFVDQIGRDRPEHAFKPEDIFLLEDNEAESFLKMMLKKGFPFFFDYETSSVRYHEGIHEIYTVSVSFDGVGAFVFQWKAELRHLWKELLEDPTIPKFAQGIKHEHLASHWVLDIDPQGWEHDTMVAAHVLDESKRVTNLKKQNYIRFGYPDYGAHITPFLRAKPKKKNRYTELDQEETARYCGEDSRSGMAIARIQKQELKEQGLEKAYDLFHEGTLSFTEMEKVGIHIDVPKAEKLHEDWGAELEALKAHIQDGPEGQKFKEVHGRPMKHNKKLSDHDLRTLLFDILKFKPLKQTKTSYSVDAETLRTYADESELVRSELRFRKLFKLRNTYLEQFLNYQIDGFLYPDFNLHLPRSYRSSSSNPNFQNIPNPKRDPSTSELVEIRRIIIPRVGNVLVEVDYGSMEVRILACQSEDPVLMDYIFHDHDMHGDEAEHIFCIKKHELEKGEWKKLRFWAKNGFVFPLFYGSYYKSIARYIPMPEDWYPTLPTYPKRFAKWEAHIKDCEQKFWRKYKKTREWQDQCLEAYQKLGYIDDGAWGFRRRGYISRNMIYNFPIQGPAFHCLLWTINQILIHRKDEWASFSTLLCGEIHDALFFDCVPDELPKLQKFITKIMTEDIREANPWIKVPLLAEWASGENWAAMKDI